MEVKRNRKVIKSRLKEKKEKISQTLYLLLLMIIKVKGVELLLRQLI
jgi:hypothetical protein